jgi:hypothetical protein
MKQEWGREEYAGDWPSDKAVWTIAAFFVALASVAAVCAYRYERAGGQAFEAGLNFRLAAPSRVSKGRWV